MIDGWHRVVRNGIEIEFRLEGENPETVENIDAAITLPDGQRWGATLLTIAEVERILDRWKKSGEAAHGLYLRVPDLILMSVPGIDQMTAAIFDLFQFGDEVGFTPLNKADGP